MQDPLVGVPKAELHVHLEGSISPQTLLQLARRHGVELPATDLDGLRQWFQFRDFEHFVDIFLTCSRCLRDAEDFLLITQDFAREQVRQGVIYTEAHFTLGTHIRNGGNASEIIDALQQGVLFARELGLELRFIFDIIRNIPDMADDTLEWALKARDTGIMAAIGLSGFEDHPTQPFAGHFEEAERQGLHRTAHAGEHAGPESIEAALEYARAERIGHGIRAIDSPALVTELATQGVMLEVCPTSNVQLHAVADFADHPFRRLDEAGIQVTVNSDDPPLFNTTLLGEYRVLQDQFEYDRAGLVRIARNAFIHSFAEPELRQRLLAEFDRCSQPSTDPSGSTFEQGST